MRIDAKVVDTELRNHVFGVLKDMGFARRKALKLWRDHEFFVDIVQFRHFNQYTADVIGTETFSVSIEMGVFFRSAADGIRKEGDRMLPDASDGYFRGSLVKRLTQSELKRRDIWHVNSDGSNLDAVIADAVGVVRTDVPEWFERVHDLNYMRELLQTGDPTMIDEHIFTLHGFGYLGSPRRQRVIAAVDEVLIKTKDRSDGNQTNG